MTGESEVFATFIDCYSVMVTSEKVSGMKESRKQREGELCSVTHEVKPSYGA